MPSTYLQLLVFASYIIARSIVSAFLGSVLSSGAAYSGHGDGRRTQRVNPLLPIPREFGVKLRDPLTGRDVFFDDCFRYAGDLVDGDMKAGDLVEAKGPRKAYLYAQTWSRAMDEDVAQAKKQVQIARARGVGLKWYFAEQGAADMARERFRDERLKDIVIATMPPRRRP